MRKVLLSVMAMVFTISMFGQLPVDSAVQMKNVVLEEYTGINCPYCPAGHKIANDIQKANPGDVFLINVHTGYYANPSGGQPDFRTQYGSALVGQTDLQGYPAGTVNRHVFPGMSQQGGSGTAMSRGDWQTAANQVLQDSSYVNIAMDAQIDLQSRQMTVDAQVYFTQNTAPSSVNLNIIVNQNNIPGPQAGASNYNPSQVLPNGKYNHIHMLRDMITGQWGDAIDTTSQGTLIQRQYTYNIPANINNIPVEMGNIEVIGFIAETHQEIITGEEAHMSYVTPPGISITDLAVEPMVAQPGLCDDKFTPKVKVRNKSSNPVDTFRVGYDLNGNGYTYKTITNTLAANDSTVIAFSDDNLVSGTNTVTFDANVDSTYHLLEMVNSNNKKMAKPMYTLPANTFDTQLWEDFETYSSGDEKPAHALVTGAPEKSFVLNQSGVNGLNRPIGAYGKSENSYFFYFFKMSSGEEKSIIFEKLDLSSSTNTSLRFDHAYAQYSSENDKLKIMVSSDCGANWTTLYEEMGSALATAAPVSGGNFFPEVNQWASDTVDMSAMDGKSEVILKVQGISDYGNNLYVDNLVIYDDVSAGIQENKIAGLNVFPNPARDFVNVDMELKNSSKVTFRLINSMGQVVKTESPGNLTRGSHQVKIHTYDLAAGLYNLQIVAGDNVSVEQISIQK